MARWTHIARSALVRLGMSTWARLVLLAQGIVFSGFALRPAHRDRHAGLLATLGFGAFLVVAFADRLRGAKIGPFQATIDPQIEDSTGYLSGNPSDPPLPDEDDWTSAARAALAGDSIDLLLNTENSRLAGSDLRLYLLDQDRGYLTPVTKAGQAPPSPHEWFRPGAGATGMAFTSGEFVTVVGAATSDSSYGLTAEQQERFDGLTAVASIPVINRAGLVLGVLTASTSSDDGDELLTSSDAYEEMVIRAAELARVLIDLLRWFDDGYA